MTASDDTNTHSEAFSEDQNADLSFVLDCLDTMSLGLSVARLVDDELNIVLCNQRYIEILEFPEELAVMPCPFEAYMRYNAERGD